MKYYTVKCNHPKHSNCYNVVSENNIIEVFHETMQVCDNIVESLNNPKHWDNSEFCEVAQSILR